MPEERYAHMYADGAWSTVVDEIAMFWDQPENGSLDSSEVRRKAGFSQWVRFGNLDGHSLPMSLEIYQREKEREPQYEVLVEGTGGHIPSVYARTLPDVMDLLSKWAPAVQASAVADLLRQLNEPDDEHHYGKQGAPAIRTLRDLSSER